MVVGYLMKVGLQNWSEFDAFCNSLVITWVMILLEVVLLIIIVEELHQSVGSKEWLMSFRFLSEFRYDIYSHQVKGMIRTARFSLKEYLEENGIDHLPER